MSKSPPINAFWQAGRSPPGLMPAGTPVEGRSRVELIRWAEGMAGLLTYVDEAGQDHHPQSESAPSDIPWAAFLRSDVILLLAEICQSSPSRDYHLSRQETANLHEHATGLLTNVLDWHDRAKQLSEFAAADSVEAALNAVLYNALANELFQAVPDRFRPVMRALVEPAASIFVVSKAESDAVETLVAQNHVVHSLLSRVTGQIAGLAHELLERALSDKSDHPPQVGLLLAFLDMYSHAQDAMNGIAERHLDYYYGKVLGLKPRAAQIDQVDVAFTLAPQTEGIVLPPGTRLVGADSGAADPIVFVTDDEIRVDPIVLVAQKALRVNSEPGKQGCRWVSGISAFPIVNSKDGRGAAFDLPGTTWPCFGPDDETPATQARIGFAIAAPTLSALGGDRTIALELHFAHSSKRLIKDALDCLCQKIGIASSDPSRDAILAQEIAHALSVSLTSGKQTSFEVQRLGVEFSRSKNTLRLELSVSHDDPPIAADPSDPCSPDAPLVEVALRPEAPTYALSLFVGANVEKVDIAVAAKDCRTSVLSTAVGPIDPTKSFEPFGAFAEAGSALYIDNPVLHLAELSAVSLSLAWKGIPATSEDFTAAYEGYENQLTADSFRVSLEIARDKSWYTLSSGAADYALFGCTAPGNKLSPVSRFSAQLSTGMVRTSNAIQPSALRLVLTAPKEGFGQSAYTGALTSFALAQVKQAESLLAKVRPPKKAEPPKPPLKLEVTDLTIAYSTRQSGRVDDPTGPIRFFSLTPLGQKTAAYSGQIVDDDYDFDGTFLMGFAGINPPQVISLYLDIETSHGSPWSRQDDHAYPDIVWRYFNGSNWCDFDESAALEDGTLGLRRAGIVRISLPANLASGPRYPDGLLWIALAMKGDTSQIGNMRAVLCNAVSASRLPDDRVPCLPANTMVRLETPLPAIKTIAQPRPSWGGRAAEDLETFRIRVSERLSHKGRAITRRDYGRIILEAFPDIAQVSIVTKASGQLVIYATPQRLAGPDAELRMPYWQRRELAGWLGKHTGLERKRILVLSPVSEQIRVSVNILKSPNAAPGIVGRVNRAINQVIAPWQSDPQAVLPIGTSRLDTAALSAAIEEVDGVDLAEELAVVQMYRDAAGSYRLKDSASGEDTARLRIFQGFDPGAVLVPASEHDIKLIGIPAGSGAISACESSKPDPSAQPEEFGIGEMMIGRDFILAAGKDRILARADRTHPSAPYPTRFPPFENGTHR